MKYLRRITFGALAALICLLQVGCYGSFSLTNKVYEWNTSHDDKFVNELIFILFLILPVYSISFFIDGIILNSIEFWTGSNPIAMKPGEKETQIVQGKDGNTYLITATQNRFDIEQTSGDNEGKIESMIYDPADKSWNVEKDGSFHKIVRMKDDKTITAYYPNGKTVDIDLSDINESYVQQLNYQYFYSDLASK